MEAIATKKDRILLTLATGTGKTFIAFQIAWKLFQSRWNLKLDGSRRPRILFLADRNILADQAYNAFSAFAEDALVRISPKEISKKGMVPTNGSIFFTIFQTFMSGTDPEGKPEPYFGAYPADYFDFIIIDECHRGGANDEGNWRSIMEYFSPAVQLGLTATPKRQDNIDTYKYFGEPVYIYSLKEGINDGFLTPFKVKRIKTTLDDYIYTSDDQVIEGEIEEGKIYTETDFNRIIEIKEREAKRVRIYMDEANQKEKAIIFCATQDHAAAVRDLVNQYKKSTDPNYCVRVTANDGEIGEQFLREFQDNEKTIPTILTTSQKLSTGVDARNIRNIVLMRPVNSMIEFKQIVGRGTRLFDGKDFFTIYDFVDAYHHFSEPEWDGEALPCEICGKVICECPGKPKPQPQPCSVCGNISCTCIKEPQPCYVCGQIPCVCSKKGKVKVKLRDGKEREIQSMISTSFWSLDGKPISAEEFLNNLFGELPNLFKSEEELRTLWSNPMTRRTLLEKLDQAGFGKEELSALQKLIDAEKSDLFDVLEYVFNSDIKPMTREARVAAAQATIFTLLDNKQKEFIEFVLSKYIETGVEELDQDKLPILLTNKYQSLEDAKDILGDVANISKLFVEFQQYLYKQKVA
jgi:type I restriction enzyme R subunit